MLCCRFWRIKMNIISVDPYIYTDPSDSNLSYPHSVIEWPDRTRRCSNRSWEGETVPRRSGGIVEDFNRYEARSIIIRAGISVGPKRRPADGIRANPGLYGRSRARARERQVWCYGHVEYSLLPLTAVASLGNISPIGRLFEAVGGEKLAQASIWARNFGKPTLGWLAVALEHWGNTNCGYFSRAVGDFSLKTIRQPFRHPRRMSRDETGPAASRNHIRL